MKRLIYLSLTILLWTGFGCGAKEPAAIRINDIRITEKEFEAAFQASRFSAMGESGRKEFLDSYVFSKLILNEAEKLGLDKDPQFLNEIQFFWEKALLKLILSQKTEELAREVEVSEGEIVQYYQQHKDDQFPDKQLPQVHDQIKWMLLQEKQSRAIGLWADSLRGQANIRIDYKRLDIKE